LQIRQANPILARFTPQILDQILEWRASPRIAAAMREKNETRLIH
jgi:hypothetical protein